MSVFFCCSSGDGARGDWTERVPGSSAGGGDAEGVRAFGTGGGGTLAGESSGGGGEEGDTRSFGDAEGGEVVSPTGFWSSGVEGAVAGSTEGGGEVGRGGAGSSFGGGDVGRGGARSSEGGGDVGKGGAGDSGGGGEAGSGGAGASGRGGRLEVSSLKQTHFSPLSSVVESCSGPKILSKSAIEGFLVETSASVDSSETQRPNAKEVILHSRDKP